MYGVRRRRFGEHKQRHPDLGDDSGYLQRDRDCDERQQQGNGDDSPHRPVRASAARARELIAGGKKMFYPTTSTFWPILLLRPILRKFGATDPAKAINKEVGSRFPNR